MSLFYESETLTTDETYDSATSKEFPKFSFGSALGTVARTPTRLASYFMDMPNLINESVQYSMANPTLPFLNDVSSPFYNKDYFKDNKGLLGEGYQGRFGEFQPTIEDRLNRGLLSSEPDPDDTFYTTDKGVGTAHNWLTHGYGASLRDANPLALFDDKDKITYSGEKELGIFSDFAVMPYKLGFKTPTSFGAKIPFTSGTRLPYSNFLDKTKLSQALASGTVGLGSYQLGGFESGKGLLATIIADVLATRGAKYLTTPKWKAYIEQTFPNGLTKDAIARFGDPNKAMEKIVELNAIHKEFTGQNASILDHTANPKIKNIMETLNSTQVGQEMLATWLFDKNIKLGESTSQLFSNIKQLHDSFTLGKMIHDNLKTKQSEMTLAWRENFQLIDKSGNKKNFLDDTIPPPMLEQIQTYLTNVADNGFLPLGTKSGDALISTQTAIENILKEFMVLDKKSGTWVMKDFKSLDTFINKQKELKNQYINSADVKSSGASVQLLTQVVDNISYLGQRHFPQWKKADDEFTKTINDILSSNEALGSVMQDINKLLRKETTNFDGKKFIDNIHSLIKNEFMQPQTMTDLINALEKSGNTNVISKIMPLYLQKEISKITATNKHKALSNPEKIASLFNTDLKRNNITNWLNAVNKSNGTSYSMTQFRTGLEKWYKIMDNQIPLAKNSTTAEKLAWKDKMESSGWGNVANVFKLDFSFGIPKNLAEWSRNTNERAIIEILKHPDGLKIVNAIASETNPNILKNMVQDSWKIVLLSSQETLPDRKLEKATKDKVDQMNNDIEMQEQMRNNIISGSSFY